MRVALYARGVDTPVGINKRFGDTVQARRIRHRPKLTQAALGEAIGMSVNMIGKIERGETGVSFENVEKFAEFFGVDVSEMFAYVPKSGQELRPALLDLTTELASLSDDELKWTAQFLKITLRMLRTRPKR